MKHIIRTCPQCGNDLTRIKRSRVDRLINFLTFSRLHNKRYYCYSCLKSFTFSRYQLLQTPTSETIGKKDLNAEANAIVLPNVGLLLVSALLTLIVLIFVAGNHYILKNRTIGSMSVAEKEMVNDR